MERTAIALLICALWAASPARSDTYAPGGTDVVIPLRDSYVPASDLVYIQNGQREILSPDQALQLKKSGVDLSTLDPDDTTDFWQKTSTFSDEKIDSSIPVQSGDQVTFLGYPTQDRTNQKIDVTSDSLVVNVLTHENSQNSYSLLFARNLHTFLLRKELFRKLGYKVAPLKYLSRVQILFPDQKTRDSFLKVYIPNFADGASDRWQVATPANSNPLLLTFQDIAIIQNSDTLYPLEIGPVISHAPGNQNIDPAPTRVLRALALGYGLVNLPETVNQMDWTLGRIDSQAVTFHVLDIANFSCTTDDAIWILRKIEALQPEDFSEIVANSYFPDPVAKLVLQKLLSRRNSILEAFNLPHQAFAVDSKLSDGKIIQNGRLIQKTFPGYASNYAAETDPQDPFENIRYLFFGEGIGNVIENLADVGNAALPGFTEAGDYSAHLQDLINKGFTQLGATGVPQGVPFGAWFAPIANGGVNLSRDIILGNYLGTNHLVQLEDTFGFYINAGLLVGVDGLPQSNVFSPTLQGMVQGTLNLSITHLKPLSNLKDGVTQPIKNIFVPWFFKKASDLFQDTGNLTDPHVKPPTDLLTKLQKDINDLDNYLAIGESLIITETLSGDEQVRGSEQWIPVVAPAASLEGDVNQVLVSRVQIYRRDATTIVVYKDSGDLNDLMITAGLDVGLGIQFPILSFETKGVAGSAQSKVFTVNINPDTAVNPTLYSSSIGLKKLFQTGSVEILQAANKPAVIGITYHDKPTTLQALHYQRKTLRGTGDLDVKLADGKTEGHYILLNSGIQTGVQYQQLAGDVGSFLLQELTKNPSTTVDAESPYDPGRSFLGSSYTRSSQFQARNDSGLSSPYVRVEYRWDGWAISQKDILARVHALNNHFGFTLYPDSAFADTSEIKLYELTLDIHLYENALDKMIAMNEADENAFEGKYIDRCYPYLIHLTLLPGLHFNVRKPNFSDSCAGIAPFRDAFHRLRSLPRSSPDRAQLIYAMASSLERFADFDDLVKLAGGQNNMAVSSSITGFRTGSEELSNPIDSNTFGKPDPNAPNGIIDTVQAILGVDEGEFDWQWLRDYL